MKADVPGCTARGQQLPLLTVAFISYNRLHYLRATLESARHCIHYPRVQWMVADASIEPGLRDYLRHLDWVDDLILQDPRTTHIEAMNEVVTRARGEIILIWPDDMQFIVAGDWMAGCVEILVANPWLGSMSLNALRHPTITRLWTWRRWLRWRQWAREARARGRAFRRQRRLHASGGFAARTFGWTKPGIIGSGIPSLTRTAVWRSLGPWWRSRGPARLVDSSGGGEAEMLLRYERSGLALQRAQCVLPVAADIVTDAIGSKSKVRGGKRYGVYASPPEGEFFYHIYNQQDVQHLASRHVPVGFEEIVRPLGYSLPLDGEGNLLKAGIDTSVVTPLAGEEQIT